MMRVKLNKTAPPAYFRKSEKQHLGYDIVDVSDDHAKVLIRCGEAELIKILPKKTGPNKPLKFGDKVTWRNHNAIFLEYITDDKQWCSIIVKGNQKIFKMKNQVSELKRGWKK